MIATITIKLKIDDDRAYEHLDKLDQGLADNFKMRFSDDRVENQLSEWIHDEMLYFIEQGTINEEVEVIY